MVTTAVRSDNDLALDVMLKKFGHHYYGGAIWMGEGTSYITVSVAGTAVYATEEKS